MSKTKTSFHIEAEQRGWDELLELCAKMKSDHEQYLIDKVDRCMFEITSAATAYAEAVQQLDAFIKDSADREAEASISSGHTPF